MLGIYYVLEILKYTRQRSFFLRASKSSWRNRGINKDVNHSMSKRYKDAHGSTEGNTELMCKVQEMLSREDRLIKT